MKSNEIDIVCASSLISVSIGNFVLWSLMFIKVVWKIGQIVELRPTEVTYEGIRSRSVVIGAAFLVNIAGLGLPRPGPFLSEGICRIGLLLLIYYWSNSIFADVIALKGLDQSLTASCTVHHLAQCLISHKVSMWPCLGFFWLPTSILAFFRVHTMIVNCGGKSRCCSRELSKLILHSC